MNKVILLLLAFAFVGCSSAKRNAHTDYAQGCVETAGDPDVSKNVTAICLPMDTYTNSMHFYKTRSSERRTMPDLDSAMDRE